MTAVSELRTALGLTQREFAECLGVSQGHLSAVETGKEGVSKDLGLAIVDQFRSELYRLGYTLEDVLRGRGARSAA